MVGVVHYSGSCCVCPHPMEAQVTAALLAQAQARDIADRFSDLTYRDVKMHEQQCLTDAAYASASYQGKSEGLKEAENYKSGPESGLGAEGSTA